MDLVHLGWSSKAATEAEPCAVKVLHHVAMQIQLNLLSSQGNSETIAAFNSNVSF